MRLNARRPPISTALFVLCAWLAAPGLASAQPRYITAHLQASTGHYVVAENGGPGALNANRCCPGPWETFAIIDVNGGALENGDQVHIQTWNYWYWFAWEGGGSWIDAKSYRIMERETFYIVRASGSGPIVSGDQVGFRTYRGFYVVAEGGGGGGMNANRYSLGPWETFTITIP